MKKVLLLTALIMSFTAGSVHAGKYDIKEMTPAVKSALESRRDRFGDIEALKASGALGENNKGYVQVLKDTGSAASLAAAENKDRKVIYQTIVEQNNLKGAISAVEKVFAEVQRNKAESGEMIQLEDGSWTTK